MWSFSFIGIYRKKEFEYMVKWRILKLEGNKLAVKTRIFCNEKMLATCSSIYAHICMVLNHEC